ncbi:MAG: patatin family protein [Lachnospiraceae bacterium]|nr:patatin family protein [Lachnospiraceae bacterium]
MSTSMVLEGGGLRGLYTVGVLDVFMDNDIKVDTMMGVSAGALFGVNYPSRQRGRGLRYNLKYAKDPRYMGFRSLIKTGNIANKEFGYYEIPFKLDVYDEEAFEKAGIDFYVVATNVETGKAEYIKIDNALEQMEAFRATSSMPIVSKIVEYEGKKYLDGGCADSIPVNKCMELGCDKMIVVLTRTLDYRKKKENNFLNSLIYRKYPEFVNTLNNRPVDYNKTLEEIIELEKQGKAFVIRPSQAIPIKRIEHDTEVMQRMYNLGVEDAKRQVEDLKKYLES